MHEPLSRSHHNPQANAGRVTQHFATVACQVPAAVGGGFPQAGVLFAPLSSDPGVTAACERVLSSDERQRADRFGEEGVRRAFVQRRAFRRYAVDVALGSPGGLLRHSFAALAKGRPWLPAVPQLSWSFSSCRSGMLAAWSPAGEIGVDVEEQGREVDFMSLARRYYAPEETDFLLAAAEGQRKSLFLRFWCLKEAILKAIGEGLAYGLDRFAFTLEPAVSIVQAPEAMGGVAAFQAAELVSDSLHSAGVTGAVVLQFRKTGCPSATDVPVA